MNPNPADLFGLAAEVDLVFEKIGDSDVIERHKDLGTVLLDELNVLDEQQIVRCGDSEPADFRRPQVTQDTRVSPRQSG